MNEAELRVHWEERVSTTNKAVLDKLWQDLTVHHGEYIDDALRDSKLITDLVDLAEDRIEYWRFGSQGGKPPGRAARTVVDVDLDSYEKECAETASLYLAKKAASLPVVRRFREERLGGRLLTTEEAEEFLRVELQGDVPDDHQPNEYEDLWIDHVKDLALEELLEYVRPASTSVVASDPGLLFPYESSGAVIVTGTNISENYADLCVYLVAMFPWKVDQAALFVLTGERPEVVPLELSFHRRRRVLTLNFAPWISEKTFRKAYRKCQKIVQGGDNRRMQERTLAVMRFVTKHTDDEGRRQLSWSQLTDHWNEEHPGEWGFKGRSGLRKAYLRAAEELVANPWR